MVWDTFCLVCGGPPSATLIDSSPALVRELGDELSAELAWLDQHVGVQADSVVVEGLDYDNSGAYTLPEGGEMLFHAFPNYKHIWDDVLPGRDCLLEGDLYGLTCHMACYHFLHDKLKYKLQFEDIWPILELNSLSSSPSRSAECLQSDYGGITKYHDQDFDWQAVHEDGTGWMLQNPFKNKKNADRVLQVWTPLVQAFQHAHRERRKKEVRPMLTTLYCCFSKAREFADLPTSDMSVEHLLVWKRMAAIPLSLVHIIAVKAELAWE